MFRCPECNVQLDKVGSAVDGFAHAQACLNVPGGDVFTLRKLYEKRGDDHGARVLALLDFVEKQRSE